MFTRFFVCLFAALLIFPHAAHAQDSAPCTLDLAPILTLLEDAQTALAADDLPAALAILIEVRHELALIDTACSGLNLEGVPGDQIIGPVIVPEGVYKITATVDDPEGILEISAEVIDGECGGGTGSYLDTNFLSLFAEGTTGTYLFTSLECEVFWDIRADSNFTLTWEKLK